MSQNETSQEQVFEALLQAWRKDEHSIIGEWSGDSDADETAADIEMENWRRRWREAKATSSLAICWTRHGSRTHLTRDGDLTLCGRWRDQSTGTLPFNPGDHVSCQRCEQRERPQG